MNFKTIIVAILFATSPLLNAGLFDWCGENPGKATLIGITGLTTAIVYLSAQDNPTNESSNNSPISATLSLDDKQCYTSVVQLIKQQEHIRSKTTSSEPANKWYQKEHFYSKDKSKPYKTVFYYSQDTPLYYPELPESDVNKKIISKKPGKSCLKKTVVTT